MGKNTGDGFREGAVKNREQVYNKESEQYLKKDKSTGKIIAVSDNKFKGVSMKK